jgi:hypothetical protein
MLNLCELITQNRKAIRVNIKEKDIILVFFYKQQNIEDIDNRGMEKMQHANAVKKMLCGFVKNLRQPGAVSHICNPSWLRT